MDIIPTAFSLSWVKAKKRMDKNGQPEDEAFIFSNSTFINVYIFYYFFSDKYVTYDVLLSRLDARWFWDLVFLK